MDSHLELELLGQTELFRDISPEVLKEIRSLAFAKHVQPPDAIFHQGDPAAACYTILSGNLRATQTTLDGDQIIIRYLGPGQFAGYAVLGGDEHHPGTVSAVSESYLLGWSRATMRQIMARYPEVAVNAVAVMGRRYHEMQLRLRELTTQGVEQRIAHTLLRLVHQAGRRTDRGIEIAFPLSRQDLAEMTGTTLHTVSRTLSAWEKEGVVSSKHRYIVICRPDMLEQIRDGGS